MKLSVVILNYNVRYFLEQCIVSVQRSLRNLEAEIIVIDNNSSDDSCSMVKNRFPEVTLIENKVNVGFSKANNQAVKVAKGEYVCILNPDTAVSEDTFSKCIDFAETDDNIGAIGTYLLDGTGNFLPESKRNLPTPKVSLLKIIGVGNSYYANHLSEDEKGDVAVLVGAFMFLKRSIYNEVGGFDEDYFMYGEDIDFSYKITKAGYTNKYLGSAYTLHYKGESTQRDAAYYNRFYGAMQIFYKKHFKQNIFLKTAVFLGVFAAKKFHKISNSKKTPRNNRPRKAFVFTENLTLYRKLSEKLDVELKTASKSLFEHTDLKNCLFIIDVTYMPYAQIFSVMRKHSNKNNQFRICPPRCNFILGSDKSDENGSVIVF
ncbi:glycosyltransferase family 2 protein [Ulvibacter litoralis]|uniref:Glycosyltransferase, GT2 family n=1 Tax=Ulvibacter litoralis TaxID=227084 RepID=A0A1G7IV02_9FLAO|nr:glycosyltransferase family 2 protein [Ulvibacter litoralis]SDF16416.1 Glycosyltransferase, GT2 family [Ulvibacter litoralis]